MNDMEKTDQYEKIVKLHAEAEKHDSYSRKICGGSLSVERPLFQAEDGGSIPTSPLQLELREIDRKRAMQCYDRWHYLGSVGFISTYDLGVFKGGELYGCISMGSPSAKVMKGLYTPDTQDGWWEIKRLALSDDLPKNSESRVIAIAIRLIRKARNVKGIITYADDGVGHVGTIYKATGFRYMGLTDFKSDFFEEGKDRPKQRGFVSGLAGEWRPRSRKHLFVKKFNVIPR